MYDQRVGPPEDQERLGELLLTETTTIGIRTFTAERRVLERVSRAVETPYGTVNIKVATENGSVRNAAPEYEDWQAHRTRKERPFQEVWQQAHFAYLSLDTES